MDHEDLRPFVRSGVPTTSPLRMLCDLGAVDPSGVRRTLRDLVIARVVTPTAAWKALERHARPGRHGIVALRAALADWPLADAMPDSELELRMALVRTRSLPPMTFHAVVEGYEVDFLVIGTKVVVECEGHAAHGLDREQFEFDRLRDADLLAAGYVTVRITWRALTNQPDAVVRRIRAAVARFAPGHLLAGA